jgi:hypothetical protein
MKAAASIALFDNGRGAEMEILYGCSLNIEIADFLYLVGRQSSYL